MKLKRLAALALAGVLCLTNFTGCGIDPSETAATLGDQSISLGLVNFMVMYQKSAYDDSYVLYYGEDVWDMDFYGTGNTLAEDLKDSVVTSLHDMYTLKNHMAEKGVELTAEEKTAIKEATKAFMEANDAKVLEAMDPSEFLSVPTPCPELRLRSRGCLRQLLLPRFILSSTFHFLPERSLLPLLSVGNCSML